MACEEYELLKNQLDSALVEEDLVHGRRGVSSKAHAKELQEKNRAVESAVEKSRWHVQRCEKCKAEGIWLSAGQTGKQEGQGSEQWPTTPI
jgi:hypothetical protein